MGAPKGNQNAKSGGGSDPFHFGHQEQARNSKFRAKITREHQQKTADFKAYMSFRVKAGLGHK